MRDEGRRKLKIAEGKVESSRKIGRALGPGTVGQTSVEKCLLRTITSIFVRPKASLGQN